MHGRTPLLIVSLVLLCWLPATAAAAPMPPGTYGVNIGQGTVDIGSGLLPPLTLNSGTSFTVPIGTDAIAEPVGLTVADFPFSGSGITGVASVTVLGAGVTINPSDGSATLDASFYGSLSITGDIGFGSMSAICPVGSSSSPITVHLTTADGSPWDAVTGGFTMVDKSFVLPTIHCSQPLLEVLLPIVLGTTNVAGNNVITIVGTALRQPDVISPVTTPATTTQGTTSPTGGSTAAPEVIQVQNTAAPGATKACVVPRLVGKTLKQAKRALTKAGCKLGKAKKKSSKKKKGRIVKQRYKAGKKLAAGAKVPVTVSRGPKNARNHRSR